MRFLAIVPILLLVILLAYYVEFFFELEIFGLTQLIGPKLFGVLWALSSLLIRLFLRVVLNFFRTDT